MKILVIGKGGREYIIGSILRESPRVTTIFSAPGNAGTSEIGVNVPIDMLDNRRLVEFALREKIGLTVVGPDRSLASGVVNDFQTAGLRIFGPTKAAARFEWSKVFGKEFMLRHGIPTAKAEWTGDYKTALDMAERKIREKGAVVIKADGLADGKGVKVTTCVREARKFLKEIMVEKTLGSAADIVLIEERLVGEELSIHAPIDGKSYLLFPPARDYKKSHNGNKGENCGGMGAVCTETLASDDLMKRIRTEILKRFMEGLTQDGIDFQGMLYVGVMITEDGPMVLEFNCRFGDPEAQVLLPKLEKPYLVDLLLATTERRLSEITLQFGKGASVCVAAVSGNYPGKYEIGKPIILKNIPKNVRVIHAGTKYVPEGDTFSNRTLITSGGRVIYIEAEEKNVAEASKIVYKAMKGVMFSGIRYREDIGDEL